MLLMRRAHIGEVQVGLWPQDVLNQCAAAGVELF
jgi:aspartate--ammonia ligase